MVITLLAVFAGAIMPSIWRMNEGQNIRGFFSQARNVMQSARERAITSGVTRKIRYDDGQHKLVVETTDAETGQTQEDRGVSLPEGVTAASFRIEKNDSNSSEWEMGFYPDGKSDGGAIQFTADGRDRTLVISPTGVVRLIDGAMPDVTQDEWDAGGFEQRV